MNPYWTTLVKQLEPYVPGEQPRGEELVKLNTNENPYGPSPTVLEAIRLAASDELRLYPDSQAIALREAIAKDKGVEVNNVFVGNGSDEVLALSFLAFFSDGDTLQYPDISYSFYPVYCNLFNIKSHRIVLQDDMTLALDDFSAESGVIFPNPNAPTSIALGLDSINSFLPRMNHVVLIDEAYVDFGAESAVPLIKQYPNLLVTQTFSKSRSLAGLRAGFAIGDASLIAALERVKDSFNSYPLDTLAQAAATAAMKDIGYFNDRCAQVIATRDKTADQMRQLGFDVKESSANFLFASHPNFDAKVLHQSLRGAGFLTRHWQSDRIAQYLRITVGTAEQMSGFVKALQYLTR